MTGPEMAAVSKAAGPVFRLGTKWYASRHPVRLELVDEPLDYMRAWTVVTPEQLDLSATPVGMPTNSLRAWLVAESRAVAADEGFATLVITNTAKRTIRISDISAEVLERAPALAGSCVEAPPAGASDIEGIYFDLDNDSPALMDRWPNAEPMEPYFRHRQVSLVPDESVTFALRVHCRASACAWRPVVTASVGRKRRVATTKTSLRVSGSVNSERFVYRWWEQQSAWYRTCPLLVVRFMTHAICSLRIVVVRGGVQESGQHA